MTAVKSYELDEAVAYQEATAAGLQLVEFAAGTVTPANDDEDRVLQRLVLQGLAREATAAAPKRAAKKSTED